MEKFTKTGLLIMMIISLSGCQTKGLLSYQDAARTTQSIEKGEVKFEVNLINTFDKTGLTFEAEKELSDYEKITIKIASKYDITDIEQMETNVYYILGGMGIDASVFIMDEQLILQLPIINMYMVLNEENAEQFSESDKDYGLTAGKDSEETKVNPILDDEEEINSDEVISIDVEALLNSWLNILNEENIVVGNNIYVLTKEGQIKTTEYSFHLTETQIQELVKLLIDEIDVEMINRIIKQKITTFGDEEILLDIESFFNNIKLTHLEGNAFVDFDNRLIQQEFTLYGNGIKVEPGDLDTFQIKFDMEYTNLGEDQQFDFPTLTEKNTVDEKELEEIFDMLENIGGL